MGHDFIGTLTFPVPFPDEPPYLVMCHVAREAAHQTLGLPHLTDWVEGLGMCDFWGFEYACGLQVVYEFHHCDTYGIVLADSPEVDHIVRHCPFDHDACVPVPSTDLDVQLDRLLRAYPVRETEIRSLHAFQVWRQDDNGNAFTVGGPTSERDARCWAKQLESLGHKQSYWYSHAIDTQDQAPA